MKTIVLRNNSDSALRITLEPWAESYDIASGVEVDLSCDLKEGEIDFEINFGNDDFLALWVPHGTRVLLEGQPLNKLKGDEIG
jgi:hypothetical protein